MVKSFVLVLPLASTANKEQFISRTFSLGLPLKNNVTFPLIYLHFSEKAYNRNDNNQSALQANITKIVHHPFRPTNQGKDNTIVTIFYFQCVNVADDTVNESEVIHYLSSIKNTVEFHGDKIQDIHVKVQGLYCWMENELLNAAKMPGHNTFLKKLPVRSNSEFVEVEAILENEVAFEILVSTIPNSD